jgi:hypothetical protein
MRKGWGRKGLAAEKDTVIRRSLQSFGRERRNGESQLNVFYRLPSSAPPHHIPSFLEDASVPKRHSISIAVKVDRLARRTASSRESALPSLSETSGRGVYEALRGG